MTKKTKKQIESEQLEAAENDNQGDMIPPSPSTNMSNKSVGTLLTEARRSKRKEVDRIAKELRISADKLRAMEEDNFTALPGRVYAIGFLRTYANYLGLDGEDMIEKFKIESSGAYKRQTMILPAAPPPRRMPSKQILIIAATLLIVVYTIWYFTTSPVPQPVEQPEASDTPAAVAKNLDEQKTGDVAATIAEDVKSQPGLEAETTETIKDDVGKVVEGMTTDAALNAKDETAQPPADASTATAATPEATATDAAATPQKATLVAKAENWVQLIEPNGVALLSKVMSAGETFEFSAESGLTLTTGNAGALEIKTADKTYPLGKDGQVLQNYAIDLKKLGQ